MRKPAAIVGLFLSLNAFGVFSMPAHAEPRDTQVAPGEDLHREPAKKGWFWYLDPPKEVEEQEEEAPPEVPTVQLEPANTPPQAVVVIPGQPELSEESCSKKETWTADCGFIEPGNDFEFQAKQRDALFKEMSMAPDNPDAVEAAQRYMKWVVGKASMAANMWYFNMIQNPDLDPRVANPISQVGIALASKVQSASKVEFFKLIQEEGGVLFFFSRQDCIYCHTQSRYSLRVAHEMGLQLINIPLDGQCMPGFDGDNCGDNITPDQVAVLDVRTVPALYLYVPDNTWIRLGTGIVTDESVIANTVNFFAAYRAAMLNGLDNGKGVRPSVTFDPTYNVKPTGIAPSDGSTKPAELNRESVMNLLGYRDSE